MLKGWLLVNIKVPHHVARAIATNIRKPFKTIVNEALRAGLDQEEQPAKRRRYQTEPHPMGLRPGRNIDKIQELLAQIEGEESRWFSLMPTYSCIRIGTNPRVFEYPLSLEQSLARIQSWLDQPCTRIIRPTERHWTVFQHMLTDGQAVANLVIDAHLAALAIEHG